MTSISRFDLLNSALHGRNLLEASAGTGKTFTIAALYLRLLLETDLTVERILVVTFTEAATEELRDRIRRRLHDAHRSLAGEVIEDDFLKALLAGITSPAQRFKARNRLNQALICFDEAAIYTIHGFCQRVLQDKAFEAGALFDTRLVTDQAHLIDEIAQDYWRNHCAGHDGPFASLLVDRKVTPDKFTKLAKQVTSDPGIKVLPDTLVADLTPMETQWQHLRQKLRHCWHSCNNEIKALLLGSSALNGNSYRQSSLPKWFLDIDSYFASTTWFEAPEPLINKLTAPALAKGTKKGAETPQHAFFALCENFSVIHRQLAESYTVNLIALNAGFIRYLLKELPGRKRVQNIRHFDDLLLDVRDRLESSAGPRLCASIRNQFQAAFIDEFQDTDPVQFSIFRHLYPDSACPVFFIGDPKQAIYSFRGADIFAYIEATKVVECRFTLATNWRSTPGLVKAVNTLFADHDRPFVFPEIEFHPVDAKPDADEDTLQLSGQPDSKPLQFWSYAPLVTGEEDHVDTSRQRLAEAVSIETTYLLQLAARGAAAINGRPLRAGDIAVLVRTHKEGSLIEQVLKKHGIPSVQSGTGSLFDSREAQEILRVLQSIADPVDESLLKAALATDLFGQSGEQIGALVNNDNLLEHWLDKFLEYNREWQSRGLIVMTGKLLAAEHVRQRLLGFADGQRRLTNVLHCFEVLHKATLEQHLGIDGMLKWFARQFEEERSQEEYQLRLETDDDAVKIVTIHKSKGLEYPIVFCPFCWNPAKQDKSVPLFFHDPEDSNRRCMDLGSDELAQHSEIASRETLAEAMRLLYVAVTRAKYRCYIAWGEFKGAKNSSLGYLLHATGQPQDDLHGFTIQRPEAISRDLVAEALETLVIQSDERIQLSELPRQESTQAHIDAVLAGAIDLTVKTFTGNIDRSWCISSFSNLTAGHHQVQEFFEPEKSILDEDRQDTAETAEADDFSNFMAFPKGATAGNCLHQLFEELDFCNAANETIEAKARKVLDAYNFDLCWTPAIVAMVNSTLQTPIVTPEGEYFTLSQIDNNQKLAEMQFFLPLANIDGPSLARVFADYTPIDCCSTGFSKQLQKLGFARHHGMLQGFIDLTFRYGERYYLLDWKSNYLGDQSAAYLPEGLGPAMQSSYYTLQYHLYLVALNRYLRRTLRSYCYEKHFGGAIYAYLRGTALNNRPESTLGLYQDRPQYALIQALDNYLSGDLEGETP